MQVSYKWLQKFIDLDLSYQELSKILTQIGLEVEYVHKIDEGIENIVIGEIKEIEKHPKADRLHITRVDVGDQTLQIVCGASNIFEGAKVPIARVGVTLPSGMTIKEAKLMGVVSYGMICSEDELGLVEERQPGVMILSEQCQAGDSFTKKLGLDDVVFELSVTPNMAHTLSMIGVAREVAAFTNKELKMPKYAVTESDQSVTDFVKVKIEAEDLCPRYTARVIQGVKIGESPDWLKQALQRAGIRSINNVVDVTNYVMLEMGQPLHAFDYDTIAGSEIVVRRAKTDEKITTLDEKERNLDNEMLLICDINKPLGIAGVMGGLNSEVTDATTNILLESAYFNPISIRKTSRGFGLISEASYRFERGVDINRVEEASNRAIQLIQDVAGGEILKGMIDVYPQKIAQRMITLRVERVCSLLGIELGRSQIVTLLEKLGYVVNEVAGDLKVTVPSYRGDVSLEADLIEDIARIYGYDNIPKQQLESKGLRGHLTWSQSLEDETKRFLTGMGLNETINFSFVNRNVFDRIQLSPEHPWRNVLEIMNPLSEEYAILRTTLIPDMLKVAEYNVKRQVKKVCIFELAKVFLPVEGKTLPNEPRRLTCFVTGIAPNQLWGQNADEFYYLKGVLEAFAKRFEIGELEFEKVKLDCFHPGRTAIVKIANEPLGYIGEVHPDVLQNYDLEGRAAIFEINFEKIVELAAKTRRFKDLVKYPAVNRDIALLVDQEIPVHQIYKLIQSVNTEYLEEVKLFDLYQGKQIPEGKKSLAFALKYRACDRTLTDDDINSIIKDILDIVKEKLGAEIRSI